MKINKNITFFFLALFTSSYLTFGQSKIIIDLSKDGNREVTQDIEANKKIELLITNLVPGREYQIIVQKKISEFTPLQYRNDFNFTPSKDLAPTDCNDLKAKLEELKTSQESELFEKVKETSELIESIEKKIEADMSKDLDCETQTIIKARSIISQINLKINQTYTLQKGEELHVTINRKTDDGSLKEWKYVYKTPSRGKWVTSYGFSFITNVFDEEKEYFSKANDTAFVITRKIGNKKLNFAPSVFFTWMPSKCLNENFSFNFTGGLGFDLEAPTVFLGGSVFYNQNLSLVLGLTAHQQHYLNGQYSPNEIINENLSKEQLHEKLYTINPFFSLTFRFKENPEKELKEE